MRRLLLRGREPMRPRRFRHLGIATAHTDVGGRKTLTTNNMKERSKRAQMQDVLQLVTQGNLGAVAEDARSRCQGPDPKRTVLVKMLLDSFATKIQLAGLNLANARICWDRGTEPDEAYQKLQQLGLLDQLRTRDSLPPENLPIIE